MRDAQVALRQERKCREAAERQLKKVVEERLDAQVKGLPMGARSGKRQPLFVPGILVMASAREAKVEYFYRPLPVRRLPQLPAWQKRWKARSRPFRGSCWSFRRPRTRCTLHSRR